MRYVSALERLPANVSKVQEEFALAVVEGLSRDDKSLPCRFFYDGKGSALFEEITRLPEYYPTRTETSILRTYASEIVAPENREGLLVEFGSGSSQKTEILLNLLADRVVYVPIDVSETALASAKARLAINFPELQVRTMVADFSQITALPGDLAGKAAMGFFPGSTIGNFAPRQASALLANFKRILGGRGRLIIGVDLKKDVSRLTQAYNDSQGVTAAFNLNLLARINRELGGNFDLATFSHRAIFNDHEGRIEMHLVSNRAQDVEICGHTFQFNRGESIHTENSYKYSVAGFRDLAAKAGWKVRRVWTDPDNLFSIQELV